MPDNYNYPSSEQLFSDFHQACLLIILTSEFRVIQAGYVNLNIFNNYFCYGQRYFINNSGSFRHISPD